MLAASTAPATSVAIIRENHAKGPTVKTLLAVVSVDSSLCILLFAFVNSLLAGYFVHGEMQTGLGEGILQATRQLVGSAVLGVALGIITTPLFGHHRFHNFSTVLVTVLFATGISVLFGFSALLTCLAYGAFLGNTSRENEGQLDALEPIEPLLYTAFFTLAGVGVQPRPALGSGVTVPAVRLCQGPRQRSWRDDRRRPCGVLRAHHAKHSLRVHAPGRGRTRSCRHL